MATRSLSVGRSKHVCPPAFCLHRCTGQACSRWCWYQAGWLLVISRHRARNRCCAEFRMCSETEALVSLVPALKAIHTTCLRYVMEPALRGAIERDVGQKSWSPIAGVSFTQFAGQHVGFQTAKLGLAAGHQMLGTESHPYSMCVRPSRALLLLDPTPLRSSRPLLRVTPLE